MNINSNNNNNNNIVDDNDSIDIVRRDMNGGKQDSNNNKRGYHPIRSFDRKDGYESYFKRDNNNNNNNGCSFDGYYNNSGNTIGSKLKLFPTDHVGVEYS